MSVAPLRMHDWREVVRPKPFPVEAVSSKPSPLIIVGPSM